MKVVLLLAVLAVALADENSDLVSELREKVTSLTQKNYDQSVDIRDLSAENRELKLQAKGESHLSSESSDAPVKTGGIRARITVTADDGLGEDDSEGFGSNDKIDLNTDFSCPTSSNTDNWIETIEVNTVGNGDNGEDYLSPGETYKPVHFTIKQGRHRRRAALGNRRRSEDVYQGGEKVKNQEWFPITLAPLADGGRAGYYFDGKLQRESNKYPSDSEKTSWYKIANGECYAMAAYIKTRVGAKERFREGSDSKFLKGMALRVLKFAVCKNVGGEPRCASKKNVVSCWYKKIKGGWTRCGADNDDKLVTAAILARG